MGFRSAALIAIIALRCVGPDLGSTLKTKERQGNGSTVVTVNEAAMPKPVILYPPAGYQTTSNHILIQPSNEPTAASYTFEAVSGSAVVAAQTVTSAGAATILIVPAAGYGTITFRLSYVNSAGKQSDYTTVDASYINFSAGTLVKSVDYTSQPTCTACAMLAFVACPPHHIFNCPAFPNNDWTNCQPDGFVATGNAWTCAAAPEGSLLTNNNTLNTYNPANTGYEYNWQNVSMTSSSYQMGHGASATNEALLTSCRFRKASECGMGGFDSGISFWYYPYRDANSMDNVEISQRDCSGNWTILAKARVTAINQIGQAHSNKLHSKIDCLGDYFTAYYKSGVNYIPIAVVKDEVKYTGRAGWGFGPGHPTNAILHRVSTFEWRRW